MRKVVDGLPPLQGRVLEVRFAPELSAHRGKLLSRGGKGRAVHAGSEIRKRLIVLDSDLLEEPQELARIFLHELHHFVWVRLGNPRRRAYEEMAKEQFGARGELGWSAEMLKRNLTRTDTARRSRRWRDYVAESFCDTGAWYQMRQRRHDEWTLAASYRERRAEWFSEYLPDVLSL